MNKVKEFVNNHCCEICAGLGIINGMCLSYLGLYCLTKACGGQVTFTCKQEKTMQDIEKCKTCKHGKFDEVWGEMKCLYYSRRWNPNAPECDKYEPKKEKK